MGDYNAGIIHKSPTMDGHGSCNIWREGNNIRVTGSASLHKGGGYNRAYGYHYAAAVFWNGTNTGNWFYIKNNNDSYRNVDKTWTANFNITLWNYKDAGKVSLVYICCGSGNGTYGNGCDVGWGEREVYSANVGTAYTAPSIWLNPNDYTKIGKVGETNYGVHYSLSKGTDNLHWTRAQIFNYNSKGHIWYQQFGRTTSSSGYWDYYKLPTDRFSDGQRYRLACSTYDGRTEPWSPDNPASGGNGLVIYTYRKPTISSVSVNHTYINATQGLYFTISGLNYRAFSEFENPFRTYYRKRFNSEAVSSYINLGDIGDWSINASTVRDIVPKSRDGSKVTLYFRRYSPSADYWSSNEPSTTFYVYYRPRIGINQAYYRKNNSQGTTIASNSYVIDDSSLTHIYTSWSYDTSLADAGYVQGYRIRLYNENNQVIKTYYSSSKSISIPKQDIPRIQQTYIDITPYYKNDSNDANNFWYFNGSITKLNFVKLVSVLNPPRVDYPNNNSNWINNQFRICFELPEDPDYNYQGSGYLYNNIEVQLNNNITIRMKDSNGHTTSGQTYRSQEAFNCDVNNITHKKKMVCCPSIAASLPTSGDFLIRVRVQKKYGQINKNNNWSEWSKPLNIKVTPITIPDYSNQIIKASHYNYMRDTISRISYTYNINWNNKPSEANNNIIIAQSRYYYDNVLKRLTEVKQRVNTYSSIQSSYEKVKFDKDNNLPTSFNTKQELITDQEYETLGSNYLITILNRCIKYMK